MFPELVERIKALIETVENRDQLYAKILHEGMKYKLPPEEITNLVKIVCDSVRDTPCAAPDTEELVSKISSGVLSQLEHKIGSAVEDKIHNMDIKLIHSHFFVKPKEMKEFFEKKALNWIITLGSTCFVFALVLSGCLLWYLNSDDYYGRKYQEIYFSKYVTQEERALMREKTYTTGFLPNEFYSSRKVMKGKINRDKQIIKERKAQAKSHNGKYSTTPAIER